MKKNKNIIKIIKPNDFHIHLRTNQILKKTSQYVGEYYNYVLVMPNLKVPINTIQKAQSYKKKILNNMHKKKKFKPLISFYITDKNNLKELEYGFLNKIFFSAKLYFKNSTNLSQHGVSNIKNIYNLLQKMEEIDMPLNIHGEYYCKNLDIYKRETLFIKKIIPKIRKKFPKLRIILEHISTKDSIKYVLKNNLYTAATVTPHHLLLNRNDIFKNGINPHFYCLPIIKSKIHQQALINIVTSGNKNFFLGSDSAPHFVSKKENSKGKPGIFNVTTSLIQYLQIFEKKKKLKNFEKFCSINGAKFYKLPINKKKIILKKKKWKIKKYIKISNNKYIKNFFKKKFLYWKLKKNNNY